MTSSVQGKITNDIPVIDYEGSQYRVDFWVDQGRDYEDAAERLALMQLLPANGGRIAEIGAGFGRLADLYLGYEQIILFDYSRTLLQDAAHEWGHDPRFVFVAGNVYSLPLASATLDTLVMVRVMHHLADVPAALQQLQRVMHRYSVGVLEYANKRNLKALARWVLRRQEWSPLDPDPVEFVKLNFDFHPDWIASQLSEAGMVTRQRLGVSHFRMAAIKKRIPAQRLAALDQKLFAPGGTFPLAPSVFLQVGVPTGGERSGAALVADDIAGILRCARCGDEPLQRVGEDRVACTACNAIYAKQHGVWDMKEAIG